LGALGMRGLRRVVGHRRHRGPGGCSSGFGPLALLWCAGRDRAQLRGRGIAPRFAGYEPASCLDSPRRRDAAPQTTGAPHDGAVREPGQWRGHDPRTTAAPAARSPRNIHPAHDGADDPPRDAARACLGPPTGPAAGEAARARKRGSKVRRSVRANRNAPLCDLVVGAPRTMSSPNER